MSGTDQNELHELLCAYLLGECTEKERERVEKALAESEELWAEKERLEGTIGFVQGAFEGDDALSQEAMAKLLADVESHAAKAKPAEPLRQTPIHQIAWYRRPMVRAAAAVAILTGGILGIRSFDRGEAAGAPEDQVARLELLDSAIYCATPDDAHKLEALDGLEGMGYLDSNEPAAGESSNRLAKTIASGRAREDAAGAPKEQLLTLGYGGGETDSDEFAGENAEESRELEALGYATADSTPEPADRLARLDAAANAPTSMAGVAPSAPARSNQTTPSAPAASPAPTGQRHDPTPGISRWREIAGTSEPQQAQDLGVSTGSDDFFLGHGETKQNESAPRQYRGPGDTVPPGGGAKDKVAVVERLSALGYTAGSSAEAPAAERAKETGAGRFGGEAAQRDSEADAVVDRWLRDDADGYGKTLAPTQGRRLDQAELERRIELECSRVLRECYRRPNEKPGAMYFRFWGDNPFELAELDRLSTFSVDVDTASYTLARRYLTRNLLPEKAQIRTEEFVNYFDPDLPAPTEETFAIHTELAPSLFGGTGQRWMLRVGVRGREVSGTERKPLAITFVVDVSGSMRQDDRLELVKHSMRLLVSQLDARDSIAIVAYSNEARLILPMTSAAQRGVIESAIQPLRPEGSTNAEAGLKMGYEVALAGLDTAANNRVVFLSDGVANVGQVDQNALNADVRRHREQGIYLNTIGVGLGNHNDVFLEQLADKGDGICDYVDDEAAARRAIVERFTGAFEPIASDVKIQVDFDPAQVYRYRLLGYENRAIADVDFRNDKVDAGEVGAGHQVVALYELERTGVTSEETPLATVHLRWKAPKGPGQDPAEIDVTEIESTVSYRDAAGSFDATSPGYKKSVLAAQFAEFLRRSTHAAGDSYETLVARASALDSQLGDPEFSEFVLMIRRAQELILAQNWRRSAYDRALDDYRRYQIRRCELEELRRELDPLLLEQLREQNETLERQIRELIRRKLEERNG